MIEHEAPATLNTLFARAARNAPDRIAVEEIPFAAITWGELDALTLRAAARLAALGVRPGDRVGVCLPKTIDSVAAILSILRAGAAYVPVDPDGPAARAAYIFADCGVSALFCNAQLAAALREELERLGASPPMLELAEPGGGHSLAAWLDKAPAGEPTGRAADPAPDHLAYILYTSGSTGRPKGVMLSHRNAMCFVNWCANEFRPDASDRFSSHAPFHFDLSIFDLYVPMFAAATVVLFGSKLGKEPIGLAEAISKARISVWYSTPSILSMLAQYGRMHKHDYGTLRQVHFAGEVFPIKHLRTLKAIWPAPDYFNLYGPTETNVCTWFPIPAGIEPERQAPYPIGRPCPHYSARVIDADGRTAGRGEEGELCLAGPGVMQGYWNLPENDARVFLTDEAGVRWYRTGDLVIENRQGDFEFVGRRDRMVKRRGYRIELGEIEAGLYRHPSIREVAVIARPDADQGTRITAVLACREGERPSVIELKRFCAEHLPASMVPDHFTYRDALPKTSTDKIDYQELLASA
ncbi:MAG: amino acid adenylation domain-containing protein [Gemmatimonadetes bacterium]|nr:amino acid adenylation domain-containing protein [Gemmatimonadota bacterium]